MRFAATILASWACCACGQGAPTPSTKASPHSSAPVAQAPQSPAKPTQQADSAGSQGGRTRIFAARPRPEPEGVAAHRAHLDPKQEPDDGPWASEAFAERAHLALGALLAGAAAGDASRVDALLTPDHPKGPALVPQQLATLRETPPRVRRLASTAPSSEPVELTAALLEFAEIARRTPAAAVDPTRTSVRIVSARALPSAQQGKLWETEAWIVLGAATASQRVQRNVRWQVLWHEQERTPKLHSIQLLAYEEVDAPGVMFAELGQHVFGKRAGIDERLLGVPAFFNRSDRLTGNAFIGGQGLAVGDVDSDGLEDLYVAMHGGVANRLYLQRPDSVAQDLAGSMRAAWLDNARGVLIVDLDGDQRQDLALGMGSTVQVFYGSAAKGGADEDAGAGFDRSPPLVCPGMEEVFSLSSADADGDGDLDLYACRYVQSGMIAGVPLPYFDASNGAPNVFFRNEGGRKFVDATAQVGLDHENNRFSLASIWEDLDADGDLDLYVSNDFGRNSFYRNDNGHFQDVAGSMGLDDRAAGMGLSVSDVDLDGHLDVYVSNMFSAAGLRTTAHAATFMDGRVPELNSAFRRHARGNTLLVGQATGQFLDASEPARVASAGWSWGARFFDFDSDGLEDLYSPSGFITSDDARDVESFFWRYVVGDSPAGQEERPSYRQAWAAIQHFVMNEGRSWNGHERNAAFLNLGGRDFADVGFVAGIDFQDDSRAIATTDWDGDGKLDFFLKNRAAPRVRFLHNRTPPRSWVAFRLQGKAPNPDAIGAQVRVRASGVEYIRRLYAGDGYLSQSSKTLHFGLGANESIESALVTWPDGVSQPLEGVQPGAIYAVRLGESRPQRISPRASKLAELAPQREMPLSNKASRAVLVVKMPMAPLALPAFDDPSRRMHSLAGKPLAITLWSADNPASVAEIQRMAARAPAWPARFVPMCVDEGVTLARARKILKQMGEPGGAGFFDRASLDVLELLWVDLFGSNDPCPLPSTILVDDKSQAVAFYFETCDLDALEGDLEILKDMRAEARSPTKLSQGQWLFPRSRPFTPIADVLRAMGQQELAKYYSQLSER